MVKVPAAAAVGVVAGIVCSSDFFDRLVVFFSMVSLFRRACGRWGATLIFREAIDARRTTGARAKCAEATGTQRPCGLQGEHLSCRSAGDSSGVDARAGGAACADQVSADGGVGVWVLSRCGADYGGGSGVSSEDGVDDAALRRCACGEPGRVCDAG